MASFQKKLDSSDISKGLRIPYNDAPADFNLFNCGPEFNIHLGVGDGVWHEIRCSKSSDSIRLRWEKFVRHHNLQPGDRIILRQDPAGESHKKQFIVEIVKNNIAESSNAAEKPPSA